MQIRLWPPHFSVTFHFFLCTTSLPDLNVFFHPCYLLLNFKIKSTQWIRKIRNTIKKEWWPGMGDVGMRWFIGSEFLQVEMSAAAHTWLTYVMPHCCLLIAAQGSSPAGTHANDVPVVFFSTDLYLTSDHCFPVPCCIPSIHWCPLPHLLNTDCSK